MSGNGSIFISAGDPSADFPGKNLIGEIKRACPEIEIPGLGGPLMQEAGLQPLTNHKKLAVLGFWEVIPRCFFFRRLLEQSVDLIKEKRPKAIILIDYPGFNLRLAARVKPLGIPIIYYISPQVWAWGEKRIRTIRELVDLMLVIFPFEEEFYQKHGIPAKFTGHPIMDRFKSIPDKETCRERVAPGVDGKIIVLLPGSRIQEVKRMLPVMAASTEIIRRKINNVRFIVAAVEIYAVR
jgi:lipid-A-disaccharide synthase